MPPLDMTLMYAAAKGNSRSKLMERSLALFIGTTKKPAITNSGRNAKSRSGKKLSFITRKTAIIEMGRVSRAQKNIKETYVSGYILTRPRSKAPASEGKTFFRK
jgi:hypothetical protein